MYSNTFYAKYAKNVFSQNGEDGILEEVLRRLQIETGWVCEFGAWDGKHLSNTFSLIQKGWRGVFIEGDEERYQALLQTSKEYPTIFPLNAFVSHKKESPLSLDSLLNQTPLPRDFDVLSIDIDGFDYQVWETFSQFVPKLVLIEINSSVATNDLDHIHTPGKFQGTGFRPMFNLGRAKGYTFLLHTGNMIFVRKDLFEKVGLVYQNELENFRPTWGAR